ncbi:MAG TPA: alpha/beta fold hydrolase [Planctomycetota bacterium]|jgi:alpha-beta hydrolase superfamily lysophospholipase|nr:alpha/beta fold hydrolase [Planctomycetota bacterium]
MSRTRRGVLLGGLALVGFLAWRELAPALPAARLLGELGDSTSPLAEGVREEPFSAGAEEVQGTLFRPAAREAPFPAFVVCHGAAKDGYRDERLVRFARALARRGAAVLAPDLEDLRRFRIAASTVDRIVASHRALCGRADLVRGARASLVGISFAGTLSLLAAADPGIRDSVPAVLAFGAYADLEGLARAWLGAAPEIPPGTYPVESYGKGILVLNSLDALVGPDESGPLRELLERFLREKKLPPRPEGLGPTAAELWSVATDVGPTPPALLDRIVSAALPGIRRVQPAARLGELRARVFLLHAAGDRLIPPGESRRLAAILGERARLLVTPLFEHVSLRGEGTGALERWRLVRFAGAFLRAAGL